MDPAAPFLSCFRSFANRKTRLRCGSLAHSRKGRFAQNEAEGLLISMSGWATFWAVTLLAALILFAVVAVVVTIGGVRDIKFLLANIQQRHGADESGAGSDSGPDSGPESEPGRESGP